mgnify:CR=1 FL=1
MFRGGPSQVQILSPQFKEHHAQAWCFFVLGLRPTGSRGFGCDRCQWQMKGAAKGEETGSVPTDQREGEQTTMFRGGPSQVQILSPQFKEHHAQAWCFFVLGLRPTGSRGFGCDRCQWQMKGAAKGEETGSVPTDQREGEQTTMFRGGPSQVQILSPQFNKKDTFLGVFFCCV